MKRLFIGLFTLISISSIAQDTGGDSLIKKLGDHPIYYVDSIRFGDSIIDQINTDSIATLSIYTDTDAVKLGGPGAADGLIYVNLKSFAKNHYWKYFSIKSAQYKELVSDSGCDSVAQYVLNGRALVDNFEGELFLIDDKVFKNIRIVDQATLLKEFHVGNKAFGVIILSDRPAHLHGNKKF